MSWRGRVFVAVVACAWGLFAQEPSEPLRIGPGFLIELDPLAPAAEPAIAINGRGALVPGPSRSGVFPVWGIHAGMPQIADVTLGMVIGERTEFLMSSVVMATVSGVLVAVRPAWAGTAVEIGYADVIVSPPDVIHAGYAGYSVRASVLRTYGNPLQVDGDQTFFGVSGSLHLVGSLLIGVYRNGQASADERWLIGLGIGIGL